MWWSDDLYLKKKNSVISIAKPKNIVFLAFTYVLESRALLYRDFGMNSYIDSEEALNTSSLQFLLSV